MNYRSDDSVIDLYGLDSFPDRRIHIFKYKIVHNIIFVISSHFLTCHLLHIHCILNLMSSLKISNIKYQISNIKLGICNWKFEIKNSFQRKAGFTLIELLVTIAIIAILAAVGFTVYNSAQKSARISKRIQDLDAIKQAIETFKSTTGKYPSMPVGTAANSFVCLNALTTANTLVPTYMPLIPDDPQTATNCYQYVSNHVEAAGDLGPKATDYKVRTHPSLVSPEMGSPEFKAQPTLIDPDRDGTQNDACAIQTSGTVTGWSIQSGSTTSCDW